MKILFTADIHLKLGQKGVPTEWSKNRFKLFFSQLKDLSAKVDLTILGGDIFDKIPSMEELELYYDLIEAIQSKCFIYSGNHEALKKNTTFLTNLKKVTSRLNPKIQIIDDFYSYENIDFIPYNKLKEYHPADIDFHGDILCTHVRGEIPPHVKPEVSLELFDRWQVVLAGDLHSYDNCQRNILYPGSPVTTSFHRSRVDTGVIIIDTTTLDHRWVKLELPQLIRKTIRAGEPMPAGEYDHVVYEVEGDVSELSMIESSELVDKKVLRRVSDIALILAADMSLADEVREYLLYILELDEYKVNELIMEFSKYVDHD
jgi:DNA repair exonuclease SbcCD nuclease subunit